ncbi:MAG: T9SS type A sorting domain-containing protein, partial [Bacteroidota bacterium]
VAFSNPNVGTAGGWFSNATGRAATILRTTDGGATWANQTVPTQNSLTSVVQIDENVATVVGAWGTILHTTTGGIVTVGEDPNAGEYRPQTFVLQQNYPNPFNPSTLIEFRMAHAGFVSIRVFDLLGREVSNIANEFFSAGTHYVRFVGSGFPSGVYYYWLQVGDVAQVKKMILLK